MAEYHGPLICFFDLELVSPGKPVEFKCIKRCPMTYKKMDEVSFKIKENPKDLDGIPMKDALPLIKQCLNAQFWAGLCTQIFDCPILQNLFENGAPRAIDKFDMCSWLKDFKYHENDQINIKTLQLIWDKFGLEMQTGVNLSKETFKIAGSIEILKESSFFLKRYISSPNYVCNCTTNSKRMPSMIYLEDSFEKKKSENKAALEDEKDKTIVRLQRELQETKNLGDKLQKQISSEKEIVEENVNKKIESLEEEISNMEMVLKEVLNDPNNIAIVWKGNSKGGGGKFVNVPYVGVEAEAGVFANGSLHWSVRESVNMEVET